ncbi:hypothetical protein SSPO_097210 [Streptomyces antimycoticus]|uniref:Uncharacterized protein n=1 Tax=Streptomyces antimycoticus TaxID=68175 RepID=A0A499UY45_9ACTN|nr:hypothetical protein SSPO_097210 [Streptomyces antimycoticus]
MRPAAPDPVGHRVAKPQNILVRDLGEQRSEQRFLGGQLPGEPVPDAVGGEAPSFIACPQLTDPPTRRSKRRSAR